MTACLQLSSNLWQLKALDPLGQYFYGLRREKKRKEAIIRYLALVGRADLHQIANYIVASLTTVSTRLTELKHSGLVTKIKWPDGSKVWLLTEEGYRRNDYYEQRDKKRGENSA